MRRFIIALICLMFCVPLVLGFLWDMAAATFLVGRSLSEELREALKPRDKAS
jgi:hypothetical protein